MQHLVRPLRDSRGSVLVVGLFTLALLALLGAAAMSTSRTDITISGNAKTINEGFYAAEVSLSHGEVYLRDKGDPELDLTINGHYNSLEKKSLDLPNMQWNDNDSIEIQSSKLPYAMKTASNNPRYTVEDFRFVRDDLRATDKKSKQKGFNLYRITAQGTGSHERTTTILRSIYKTRYQ